MVPQMQTKGTAGDQGWGWGGQSGSELPGSQTRTPPKEVEVTLTLVRLHWLSLGCWESTPGRVKGHLEDDLEFVSVVTGLT